jgi:hypothetical protein
MRGEGIYAPRSIEWIVISYIFYSPYMLFFCSFEVENTKVFVAASFAPNDFLYSDANVRKKRHSKSKTPAILKVGNLPDVRGTRVA